MNALELRSRITQKLMEQVDEVTYPSVTMLDRVEARLATPEDVAAYAETLLENVEKTQHPSTQMLNRLDGLADRLDQMEQQQKRQQAAEADRDVNGDSTE